MLNGSRADIASFYMPSSTMSDGKPIPVIVLNGNIIPDPTAMKALFRDQMPDAKYELQDYDCHVLNPNYISEGRQGAVSDSGRNMTILVNVSGQVKFGEARTADPRGFSETFILCPNPASSARTRGRNSKEWLIQSQNFRLVS